MVRRVMATRIVGRSIGSVWSTNVRHAPAPSTFAASNGSTGSDWMPASRIRNISGVHSQTSRSTRPAKAAFGWPRISRRGQADGAGQRGDRPTSEA